MPNPPYSASVLIIKENQDGFNVEIFHWDEMTENANVPPKGAIHHILTSGKPGDPNALTFRKIRNASTRADLISKFTNYVNTQFPDTP